MDSTKKKVKKIANVFNHTNGEVETIDVTEEESKQGPALDFSGQYNNKHDLAILYSKYFHYSPIIRYITMVNKPKEKIHLQLSEEQKENIVEIDYNKQENKLIVNFDKNIKHEFNIDNVFFNGSNHFKDFIRASNALNHNVSYMPLVCFFLQGKEKEAFFKGIKENQKTESVWKKFKENFFEILNEMNQKDLFFVKNGVIKYWDCGEYTGDCLNGFPHGEGKLTLSIPDTENNQNNSIEIEGNFELGSVSDCKFTLFDKNKQQKLVLKAKKEKTTNKATGEPLEIMKWTDEYGKEIGELEARKKLSLLHPAIAFTDTFKKKVIKIPIIIERIESFLLDKEKKKLTCLNLCEIAQIKQNKKSQTTNQEKKLEVINRKKVSNSVNNLIAEKENFKKAKKESSNILIEKEREGNYVNQSKEFEVFSEKVEETSVKNTTSTICYRCCSFCLDK